jgi:hypothetical protein
LPRGEDNRLPPRPLILDVTMTHDRYGRTPLHTNGNRTYTISSNGVLQPDDALKNADRQKIIHHSQLSADLPDPIVFMTVVANTSGRLYDDFLRLLFLDNHR